MISEVFLTDHDNFVFVLSSEINSKEMHHVMLLDSYLKVFDKLRYHKNVHYNSIQST